MSYTTIKGEVVFTEQEVASMLGITVEMLSIKTKQSIDANWGDVDYVLGSFGELDSNSKEKYLQDTNTNPKQWEKENPLFSMDDFCCLWKKEGVLFVSRYFDTFECFEIQSTLIDNYWKMRKYGYNPNIKETENVTWFPDNELYTAVLK